jgi:hypothetical protein
LSYNRPVLVDGQVHVWSGSDAYGSELATVVVLPFLDDDGRSWLLGRTAVRVFGLTVSG